MNILQKIQNFNWSHFNEIGREASKLASDVMSIANEARRLGKDATAEQIASIIARVKALKDGTTIDELLGQILGQAESVFDEHADERAELLKIGQKQSDDLDAPQDRPTPPPPTPTPTPAPTPQPTPPPTGILDSDPGMQAFPKDVYVTRSTPLKYKIHSGTIGDPPPGHFVPAIPGQDEPPDWHILHDSKR